jgi:hypothetical protein
MNYKVTYKIESDLTERELRKSLVSLFNIKELHITILPAEINLYQESNDRLFEFRERDK